MSELAQGERELRDTLEKGLILLFEALPQRLASRVSCMGAAHACRHAAAEEVVPRLKAAVCRAFQVEDQDWTKGNMALKLAFQRGTPVRICRGSGL